VPRLVLFGAALVFLASTTPAAAQLVENASPPGTIGGWFGGRRPLNPNRSSQSLQANIDLSGGYDRDPNAVFADPALGSPEGSWSAGAAAATARYRAGSIRHNLEAFARGDLTYQGYVRDTLVGGSSSIIGVSRFGRRRLNQLNTHLQAAYQPGFVFGAVSPALPVEGQSVPLTLSPAQGVIEQRWVVVSGTGGYRHYWNNRFQSSMQVGAGRVRPAAGSSGTNAEWQNASFTQDVSLGSSFALLGTYRADRSTQETPGTPTLPIEYQSVSVGGRLNHRFSSRRRMSLSFAAGATQLRHAEVTSPGQAVFPSYSAGLEFVAQRSWELSLVANRGVSALSGVSAIPMESDNVVLSLNGSLHQRLRYSLSGSYLRAVSVGSSSATVTPTTGSGGTAALRYGVTTWMALVGTYSYYEHRLESGLPVPSGLPAVYNRQSLRAGLTLWMPLYGSF
jgi:hypothetical protein